MNAIIKELNKGLKTPFKIKKHLIRRCHNNKMVGKTGFEPATSWSQTKRSTKLSYFPNNGAPKRSRTPNLLIRSQTLYPIELWAHFKQQKDYIIIIWAMQALKMPRYIVSNLLIFYKQKPIIFGFFSPCLGFYFGI